MPPKAVPPKAPPTCVLKENAKKLESEVADKDGLKLVLSFFVELDRFMLPLRRLYTGGGFGGSVLRGQGCD